MIDGSQGKDELEKATLGRSSYCPPRLRCRSRRIYPAAFCILFFISPHCLEYN
jgi:hypothetical protein